MRSIARFGYGLLMFLVPVAILAVGVIGGWKLIAGRERPRPVERAEVPTYVELTAIQPEPHRRILTGYGSVRAFRELTVLPQVSGEVIEQNAELRRGSVVRADALLFRIDPRDYQATIAQQEAALIGAQFELKVEEGRQVVAEREWRLLDSSVERTELSEALALRRPHLAQKQAAVAAAQSRLEQARLNLSRTDLRTPFNALVVDESVEVGQVGAALRGVDVDLVEAVELFDVYRGVGIDEGKKSLAFRVVYRDPEATLTDKKVDKAHQQVVRAALDAFDAKVRG
ncbi:MAG: biotin/lipoyl-binding protein [Planctomycetes bacterium]|nr:biotin/lipoyl-binding protein [Planctomycetota bacterium]